jgi:hypothetical protein
MGLKKKRINQENNVTQKIILIFQLIEFVLTFYLFLILLVLYYYFNNYNFNEELPDLSILAFAD